MQTAGAWRGWQAGGLEKPLIKAPQTCSHGLPTSASQFKPQTSSRTLRDGKPKKQEQEAEEAALREGKGAGLQESICFGNRASWVGILAPGTLIIASGKPKGKLSQSVHWNLL